jgi:hypothetical protein
MLHSSSVSRTGRDRTVALRSLSFCLVLMVVACKEEAESPVDADVAPDTAAAPDATADLAVEKPCPQPKPSLWCARGTPRGCCEDAPVSEREGGMGICRDGVWRCPEGTAEHAECCGFGNTCAPAGRLGKGCPPYIPPDGGAEPPRG